MPATLPAPGSSAIPPAVCSTPTPEGCGDGVPAAALSGRMRADRVAAREEVP